MIFGLNCGARSVHRAAVYSLLLLALPGSRGVSQSRSALNNGNESSASSTVEEAAIQAVQIKLRFATTVSSATAKVGQAVPLEIVQPVVTDGNLIVAAGAHARATVSIARRRGHNHREGKLVVTLQTVTRADGTHAAVVSGEIKRGSGQGSPVFGPCTFPFPADPVGLFRKGNDVVIPQGTELIATLAPSSR